MGYPILSLCLPAVLTLPENEKIKTEFSCLDLSNKSHYWPGILIAAVVMFT